MCNLNDVVTRRRLTGVWQSGLGIIDLITDILVLITWISYGWVSLSIILILIIFICNIWQGSRGFNYSYGMIAQGIIGRNPCAWCFSCCGIGHIYTLLSNWHEFDKLSSYHRYLLVRICQTFYQSIPSGMYLFIYLAYLNYRLISNGVTKNNINKKQMTIIFAMFCKQLQNF